jgi:hypothetical protein
MWTGSKPICYAKFDWEWLHNITKYIVKLKDNWALLFQFSFLNNEKPYCIPVYLTTKGEIGSFQFYGFTSDIYVLDLFKIFRSY